jgi:hypothetical protein
MTQISHEPFMMFVSRRMVPVILPLMCLGTVVLCDRCEWVFRKRPCLGVLVGVVILMLSLAGTLGGTVFLARPREWPGLSDWLDQVAAEIPPGAVVYSDAPGFAAPLRFLYGIPAYEVHALAPGGRMDPMIMMRHAAEQQTVFWLTFAAVPEGYAAYVLPRAELPLRSEILGTTRHTVPCYIRPRGGQFRLYRIVPLVVPPSYEASVPAER